MSISLRTSRTAAAAVLATGLAAAALAGCSSSTSGSGTNSSAARGASGSSSGSSSSGSSSGSSSSGSSSSAQSPAAVIKASLEAARTAKTVRLTGSGTDDGAPISLDLHYGSNGADGSITMSGARIGLVFVGSTVYFKAPDSFYRKQAGANADAVLKLVSGKWVKAPSDSSTASSFSQLADRQKLIDSFAGSFSSADAESLRKAGSSSVDGVATTTYTDDSGEGTIDVASSGTPFPMKLVSKGSDAGTLTFTDWNKAYTVSAPPASQTVKLPS